MKSYQEQSPVVIIPDQESGLAAIAELFAMKAKKEIELGVLERSTTKDNPLLTQQRVELEEISRKVAGVPQAGMRTVQLYRNVLIQQKIIEFLVPLYEQARVDEQKDVPILLVLDRATPPQRKSRPLRGLIVLAASILSAGALAIAALALTALLRRPATESEPEQTLRRRALWIARRFRAA